MKILTTSGKRKRAIARATIREGKGVVTINGADLSIVQPLMSKSKILLLNSKKRLSLLIWPQSTATMFAL